MSLPPVLNVGHSNFVLTDKVLALVSSDSAPMRRLVQGLRREESGGRLIDATQGRRTRSLVFLDGGAVALSALPQETLARRLATGLEEPEEPSPETESVERDGEGEDE